MQSHSFACTGIDVVLGFDCIFFLSFSKGTEVLLPGCSCKAVVQSAAGGHTVISLKGHCF